MDTVCFNRTFLILVLITITVLALYNYFSYQNQLMNLSNQLMNCSSCNSNNNTHNNTQNNANNNSLPSENNVIVKIHEDAHQKVGDIVREYDYKNLVDPLTEPGRRPPKYLVTPMVGNPHFNLPSRGLPDEASWLGLLLSTNEDATDDNRIIRLMGNQKYPGSSVYDYYTFINIGNDRIKVKLCGNNGDCDNVRELYDNDTVHVKELANREFKIQLNKNNVLRYNPFAF
jgi:hypothetical protein